jgi:predicted N-acetyltransferase YhbS
MPSAHTVIEDARPADLPDIEAMTLAAYGEYASQIPDHWDLYRADILATLADPQPAQQLVARRAGQIVGGVLLYPPDVAAGHPDPVVRLLAVHPDQRGAGVGTALMQACIRRARQSGAPTLVLYTSVLMRAAIRLYERLGFTRAPELDVEAALGLIIIGYRLNLHTPSAPAP